MAVDCKICNNRRHICVDGVWQRCKCFRNEQIKAALVSAGVDARLLASKLDQVPDPKVVEWLKSSPTSAWISGGVSSYREVIATVAAKLMMRSGIPFQIVRVSDLLRLVEDKEQWAAAQLRFNRCKVIWFGLDPGEVVSIKAKRFVGTLIQNSGHIRLRQGQHLVISSEKHGIAFSEDYGEGLFQLLMQPDFKRFVLNTPDKVRRTR